MPGSGLQHRQQEQFGGSLLQLAIERRQHVFPVAESLCPPDVWPKSFTGFVAIGVRQARDAEPTTLWLLFEIADGVNTQVSGLFSEGTAKPAIVAAAPLATWELAHVDLPRFYGAIEAGQVHISGDFRVFGRYTPSLLRLTQAAELWKNLGAVVRKVEESQGLAP
jgi:hypothetical protein